MSQFYRLTDIVIPDRILLECVRTGFSCLFLSLRRKCNKEGQIWVFQCFAFVSIFMFSVIPVRDGVIQVQE